MTHTLYLDRIFQALSDPTRREILMRIYANEKLTVTDIARAYPISLPAISKHIRVLEIAGLVIRTKNGKEHFLKSTHEPMKTVEKYVQFYTRDRFPEVK